jgi:vacuolar iron transporter family protein
MPNHEVHYINRTAWLRAAVLGANDGLISTASLIVGVAASAGSYGEILTAAFAGWAAGAMSMAAGEYVSVSSQADLETADLERERKALRDWPEDETQELAQIYEQRGLSAPLAREVADQLMARDPLAAHARDELGLTDDGSANPILAAVASGVAFSVGAVLPTVAAIFMPTGSTIPVVFASALVFLVALGALGAWLGGAPMVKPALRVGFWGALAMGVTAGIGALVGKAI